MRLVLVHLVCKLLHLYMKSQCHRLGVSMRIYNHDIGKHNSSRHYLLSHNGLEDIACCNRLYISWIPIRAILCHSSLVNHFFIFNFFISIFLDLRFRKVLLSSDNANFIFRKPNRIFIIDHNGMQNFSCFFKGYFESAH